MTRNERDEPKDRGEAPARGETPPRQVPEALNNATLEKIHGGALIPDKKKGPISDPPFFQE